MRVLILGGGVVGEAVAWDLTHVTPTVEVTVADRDATRLRYLRDRLPITTQQADLRAPASLQALASNYDVTVGALPSTMAMPAVRVVAEMGRRHVDVSFMAADARAYDDAAREAGAVIVFDCGVAPGLSHVLVGDAVRQLDRCSRVRIDVGGLPAQPVPPFFYKAPFAPEDVIEEYTRPARLVRNGTPITLPALSEAETIDVPGVGLLDAFNTDGLRSLVHTVRADEMTERTLRYPGHVVAMRALASAGLFGRMPVRVGDQEVVPRQLTSALLFPQWQYAEGEHDLTVLEVEVSGLTASGTPRAWRWTMVDRPTGVIPLSSMARTTGFPAAIVARWLVEGRIASPGVHPPEYLGLEGLAEDMLSELARRGVAVHAT